MISHRRVVSVSLRALKNDDTQEVDVDGRGRPRTEQLCRR